MLLMHKNSVKRQHWTGSHQDVLLNPGPYLSTTRFMLNPLLPLEGSILFGLVLMQKVVHGFTQAAELNWNLKIGTQVNQQIMGTASALIPTMDNGVMLIATSRNFLFVSLSNWCWLLVWWCSDDVRVMKLSKMYPVWTVLLYIINKQHSIKNMYLWKHQKIISFGFWFTWEPDNLLLKFTEL